MIQLIQRPFRAFINWFVFRRVKKELMRDVSLTEDENTMLLRLAGIWEIYDDLGLTNSEAITLHGILKKRGYE